MIVISDAAFRILLATLQAASKNYEDEVDKALREIYNEGGPCGGKDQRTVSGGQCHSGVGIGLLFL